MVKAKLPSQKKTKPSLRTVRKQTEPPVSLERKKRAEADTLPPPPAESERDTVRPPPRGAKGVTVPPRHSGRVAKKRTTAATVDCVTADLSKDPRREES
jgi:hypothetical protein